MAGMGGKMPLAESFEWTYGHTAPAVTFMVKREPRLDLKLARVAE